MALATAAQPQAGESGSALTNSNSILDLLEAYIKSLPDGDLIWDFLTHPVQSLQQIIVDFLTNPVQAWQTWGGRCCPHCSTRRSSSRSDGPRGGGWC